MNIKNKSGIPARIIAVHKGRFGIVSDYGEGFAQLKTKEYFYESEEFPTVGNFVLIDYIKDGDSLITATLNPRTYFSRCDPDKGDFLRQKQQWKKSLRIGDKKNRKVRF